MQNKFHPWHKIHTSGRTSRDALSDGPGQETRRALTASNEQPSPHPASRAQHHPHLWGSRSPASKARGRDRAGSRATATFTVGRDIPAVHSLGPLSDHIKGGCRSSLLCPYLQQQQHNKKPCEQKGWRSSHSQVSFLISNCSCEQHCPSTGLPTPGDGARFLS